MPSRWLVASALATFAAAAPPQPASPQRPETILSQCATRTPPVRGWEALRAECPGISAALTRLHLRTALAPQWRKTLDSRSLAGLSAVAQRYLGTPRSTRPDAAALRAASRALAPRLPAASLWDRLRTGVESWTAPLSAALQHWLASLARGRRRSSLLRVLLWTLGALFSAIALLSLYLGWRAGWLKRRTAPAARRGREGPARDQPVRPAEEPDWSALAGQPSQVLQLLIATLVEAERLEHERNLTHRELGLRARFDTPLQREQFTHIALLAERQRFGAPGVNRIPEPLLRSARMLRAQCSVAPAHEGQHSP